MAAAQGQQQQQGQGQGQNAQGGAAPPNPLAAMGGAGGMNSLMNNDGFRQMQQQLMQNPEMMQNIMVRI